MRHSKSDDRITPETTQLLIQTAKANNCDMVVADFYRVVGEWLSSKGNIDGDIALIRKEYAAYMMENPPENFSQFYFILFLPLHHF